MTGGALRDPIIDDCKNFITVDQASQYQSFLHLIEARFSYVLYLLEKDLKNLGLSESERLSIYTTIAAVLHLGNIDFEDDPDDNRWVQIMSKYDK